MQANVLLIILDSVRATNTSLHGHLNDTTPFLETLAERSTVYEQARAPGVRSLPSHVSLFTGLHVREHGVCTHDDRLKPGHTIWERLSEERGYDTGVFSSNVYLTGLPLGLREAFDTSVGNADVPFPSAVNPEKFVRTQDEYEYLDFLQHCLRDEQPVRSVLNGAAVKLGQERHGLARHVFNVYGSAKRYTDTFLEWMSQRERPWAACLNFMDTHYPFVPSRRRLQWSTKEILRFQDEFADPAVFEFYGGRRPWWQWVALEGLYDETIAQTDQQVKRIVRELKEAGEYDDTLLIVTSDHGEGFGESSNVRPGVRIAGHGGHAGLHDSVLHVPLLVKFPNQSAGERIAELASLTELRSVVENVVCERSHDSGDFVPDGPVLASTIGMDGISDEHVTQYDLDPDHYTNELRAVYVTEDGRICKYIEWMDESATVDVSGTIRTKVSATGKETVERAFADIVTRDVNERRDDAPLDDHVQRKLQDLGYV